MPNFLESNLKLLRERFPEVADFAVSMRNANFGVLKAQDGGVLYAVKGPDGQWQPLSNPVNPMECAQRSIDAMSERLSGGMGPALVVGLSPGYVFDTIFKTFDSQSKSLHRPFRHIYALVNSPLCLCAWLALADRERELKQPEVEFHLATKASEIAALCERDLSRSHLFIPVSELPPQIVDTIIEPLAKLYLKREEEAERWGKENEAYYSAMSDAELAEAIQGKAGRKPRLMMPTHTSSTVIQFSARDTCELFEGLGWETRIIKIDRDLPPWHLVKEVHEFKPDLFLFIDHLRTEDADGKLYPKDMPFATWVQDSLPAINSKTAAEAWNKRTEKRNRDFIVGYVDQLTPYGYKTDRLHQMPMVVNTRIFHPVELSEEDKAKYGCDLCFASNRGETTESVVENALFRALEKHGFPAMALKRVHDCLWRDYRSGKTYTSYVALQRRLRSLPDFDAIFKKLDADAQDYAVQRVFWLLNDLIYRYVVLEWLDNYAQSRPSFKLKLYGRDWAKHPRFGKYASGALEHGPELNKAFNAAGCCLHLNAMEGQHQRLYEILASGAPLATRGARPPAISDAQARSLLLHYEVVGSTSIIEQRSIDFACDSFYPWLSLQAEEESVTDEDDYLRLLNSNFERCEALPPPSQGCYFNGRKELVARLIDHDGPAKTPKYMLRAKDYPPNAIKDAALKILGEGRIFRDDLKGEGKGWLAKNGRAFLAAAAGDLEKAERIVESVYAMHKEAQDGFARIGLHLFTSEWKFKKALELFRKDKDKGRLSKRLMGEYIFLLGANGLLDEGAKEAEALYLEDEEAKDAFTNLAIGCVYSREPQKAYLYCMKDIEADRASAAKATESAAIAILGGDFKKASAHLAKYSLQAAAVCNLAFSYMQLSGQSIDFKATVKLMGKDFKKKTCDKTSSLIYLIFHSNLAGLPKEAASWLEKSKEIFPDAKSAGTFSTIFALSAVLAGERSQDAIRSALRSFDHSSMKNTEWALLSLAFLEAAISEHEAARRLLGTLFKLNPNAVSQRKPPAIRHEWPLLLSVCAYAFGDKGLSDKCLEWEEANSPLFPYWSGILARVREGIAVKQAPLPAFRMPWEPKMATPSFRGEGLS